MLHANAVEGPRILVADDDRLVLSTLCAGLTRAGYRVEAMDNAGDVLSACAADPPDLIVLDYSMPGMSGLEAAKQIRRSSDLPILMLTAYDDVDLVQYAASLGINGYFVKPIDSSQLVPSIELNLMRHSSASRDRGANYGVLRKRRGATAVHDADSAPRFDADNVPIVDRSTLLNELHPLVALCASAGCEGACLCLQVAQRAAAHSAPSRECDAGRDSSASLIGVMRTILRENDALLQEDEERFFIILPGVNDTTAVSVARRLRGAIDKIAGSESMYCLPRDTFAAGHHVLVGLAMFDGESSPEAVVDQAYASMLQSGSGESVMAYAAETTLRLAGDEIVPTEDFIRAALDDDRIEVAFQPVVDTHARTVLLYESLMRLRTADGVIVPPADFLPAAERSGLIRALDYRVLELVITHLCALRETGRMESLSVNLSGVHFGSRELQDRIRAILREGAIDPNKLVFEITETAALHDLDEARRFIVNLKDLGCRFSLDDFGAGYASFHYLRQLPVDYIKIDGAFVGGLAHTATDRFFVKAIVDLAKGLGVGTIAEYVGDEATLQLLRHYGVDYAQGYFIGPPGPIPSIVIPEF